MRSFFPYNRVDLPSDRFYRMRGDEAPTERKLTVDHVRMLVGLAIQPWRSAILVKWQGLLDNEGLVYVSNHHADTIAKALKRNADICKLSIPGRKSTRNERVFHTFIGSDARTSLRDYFETERGWPRPDEPVWVYGMKNRKDKPIQVRAFQEAWMGLLRRAKVVPSQKSNDSGVRYGFHVHNTRDLAISLLNTVSGLNPKCIEFWAGQNELCSEPVRYNQEAQAHATAVGIDSLQRTRLDLIYSWALIEKKPKDIESDGIVKFNEGRLWERKRSFYLYKSCYRSP